MTPNLTPPANKRSRRSRWIWPPLALLAVLAVGAYLFFDKPLPQGRSGPNADALARKIQQAVNLTAWENTGAVRWTFANHRHLWDRRRSFARVQWNDLEAQLDLERGTGLIWRNGEAITGDELAGLVDTARGYWINDSFWLNPLAKLFDPGTMRQLVEQPDGSQGLLITYTAGGNTPGDSYLWLVGSDGLPRAWQMWVSIIPLGGAEASWEAWTSLATGAQAALRHRLWFFTVELKDVAGAETLAALVDGMDPLAAIADRRR